MTHGYLVVMTACIDPSTGPARVVRADARTRLSDYVEALRFWLQLPDPRLRRILFLENSGHPLDALHAVARDENPLGKDVEILRAGTNDYPAHLHYGFAELRLLEDGLSRSRLARSARYLVKVTGRLTFPGLPRLLDRLPAEYRFAVDSRNNRRFVRSPQVFVTTQLMIFSTSFYESEIRGLSREIESGAYGLVENLLYDRLVRYRGQPGAILRWPVNVDPVGHAAHWDKAYASPTRRILNAARGLLRTLAPAWWV